MLSCQLSFLPLATDEIDAEVRQVLTLIEHSRLRVETGALSTAVFGEAEEIFSLLKKIALAADSRGTAFSLQVSISNYCGCK